MDAEAAEIDEAAYLRAVAHPMRHRILAMLSEQQNSPGRLAATLREKVNVVAYHVRRLHQLGLIDLVEVRRGRGGLEHIYAAPRHVTVSDAAWERLPPDERTRVLMTALRLMWDYLKRSGVAGGFDRPEAHFSRTPLLVDEIGWRALADAARGWLETAAQIERESAERGSDDTFDAGLVMFLFEARPFSEPEAPPPPSG